MKVGNVTERLDAAHGSLDNDEMDRSGIDLGATGRLQLMCKLAEKTDLEIPQVTAKAIMASLPQPEPRHQFDDDDDGSEQVASQCIILSNMFDPEKERLEGEEGWQDDIRDDVINEINKYGSVEHIHIDIGCEVGVVYVKCESKATAVIAVNALHGRYFGGRIIKADYVPPNLYNMFCEIDDDEPVASTSTALQVKRK